MSSEVPTGAMIVREFLTQRLAPLQAHSRPMWDLKGAEDDLRLHRGDLTSEELGKAVQILLGKDPGCLPAAHLPLYHRDDRAALAASMPDFNERGLVLSGPPDSPVPVSSGESGEEEKADSEVTWEGV